jgi:SAM-dependent methyltransferase
MDRLACPACRGALASGSNALSCESCGRGYPIENGVVRFVDAAGTPKPEAVDWATHWNPSAQASFVQKFFSFYRKAVFSRTVAHFFERHFPASGVLLEAGSGTAETSMRIQKSSGGRLLIALDLVGEVLAHCHPVMDVRIQGDIFHLPFGDASLDGIWNVGVMEHFTPAQVEQILAEMRRVLKPGAPLLLLWPGQDSLPQRLLRALERIINVRRQGAPYKFHPDEINKLPSREAGVALLAQNGFETAEADSGLRSLLAFKTLVGRRQGVSGP